MKSAIDHIRALLDHIGQPAEATRQADHPVAAARRFLELLADRNGSEVASPAVNTDEARTIVPVVVRREVNPKTLSLMREIGEIASDDDRDCGVYEVIGGTRIIVMGCGETFYFDYGDIVQQMAHDIFEMTKVN